MATAKKISPNRRKSIAVPVHDQPSLVPKNRRRAHSIVPGASSSPFSKARRSLAPRKSILKSSVVPNVDPSSQQSTSTLDDHNSIRSMDITQGFTAPLFDNTTRKSFGRRVSFASKTKVLMFETDHTASTGSPQSSPSSISPPAQGPSHRNIANENDYPGQNSRRRRSSTRYSIAGSEDMDMTTVMNPGYPAGSAILDEEFDCEDSIDNDDMEITTAISGHFARKHSSSTSRRPLSQLLTPSEIDDEVNESQLDESMESTVSEEQLQTMEFTVPLGQSLRPAHQDTAWLALKQITHSGDPRFEPELTSDDSVQHRREVGMNLEDAMERLRRARDSLPLLSQPSDPNAQLDDSFNSTEDSLEGDIEEDNRTLNLSQIVGRLSIGTDARMSLGYQDSNMDESEVYGNIAQCTPGHSVPSPESRTSVAQGVESNVVQHVEPSVFQSPSSTSAIKSGSSVFTRPLSPSKAKQFPSPTKPSRLKPTFSAAFAPPVTKPSPKKLVASRIPTKRPLATNDDGVETADADRPSPAKKPALADNWMKITAAREEIRTSPQRQAIVSKPKPLSPSKKALFQDAVSTAKVPNGAKRPSGYFARRRSLAPGSNQPSASNSDLGSSSLKKDDAGVRRLSVGSVSSVAHQFKRNLESKTQPAIPDFLSNRKENDGVQEILSMTPVPLEPKPAPPFQSSEMPTHLPAPSNAEVVEQPATSVLPTAPVEESSDMVSQEIEIDLEATQQWRDKVQQDDYVDQDESPVISISQFFQMTGIKYMDELAAPRRSLHPGMQPIPQSRHTSNIPLAEFVMAMAIDVPQLDLYSRVSRDLEAWIEKSKVVFAQGEEEAAKVTPELFIEYSRADEVGREELGHQLTLIRTHTRYLARSDWYDWKLQWVEGLRHTASEAFDSLEDDARTLEKLKKTADVILPDLEAEYEQVMKELELEQAEIKEIESCDQDYLNELKASIAEQNIEIEALKAELSEAMNQSKWIEEKLEEMGAQKIEAQNTIRTAERVLQMKQTSTRSEVFRLNCELEALEDLHMLRITKVSPKLFEYVYASTFLVSIPCADFRPIPTAVRITRSEKGQPRHKDEFPKLSAFFLTSANYLINEGEGLSVREIVHRLADFWSACSQLRSQLILLKIKYPVGILVSSSQDSTLSFKAKAEVLFPSVQAKAFVYFTFSFDTLTRWPLSLESLYCEVEVAYGRIERSVLLKAITDCLSQITPAENYACLLDACIEAQNVYH